MSTTTTERHTGERDNGMTAIIVVLAVLIAALIGMYAAGVFDRQTAATDMMTAPPSADTSIEPMAPLPTPMVPQTAPAEAPTTAPAPANDPAANEQVPSN